MDNKKAETIAYAIRKKCSEYSLIEWCESWGFTIDEFEEFLEAILTYVDMCNS